MKTTRFLLLAVLLLAGLYTGRYLYHQPRFLAGDEGPDFRAPLADGRTFALSELRGQYVLLDFWGSWCAPCLQALPGLRALYADYHDRRYTDAQNFEIVGIGVETDAARWRQGLARLQLPWPYQVIDRSGSLRFFDGAVADQYGITEVPTTYLLGPDGQVVSVNPTPVELRRLLDRRLE